MYVPPTIEGEGNITMYVPPTIEGEGNVPPHYRGGRELNIVCSPTIEGEGNLTMCGGKQLAAMVALQQSVPAYNGAYNMLPPEYLPDPLPLTEMILVGNEVWIITGVHEACPGLNTLGRAPAKPPQDIASHL